MQYFILQKLFFGIKTEVPNEHKKTYEHFKKIVESKRLDKQLAEIYEEESNKAETLLKIFFDEKRNRGRFMYNINANANKPFAEQSIKNAKFFTSTIKYLIESGEIIKEEFSDQGASNNESKPRENFLPPAEIPGIFLRHYWRLLL
ncbi:MAG: hypothetical protein AABW64_02555 [Nanoarchaeota archaeon]